MMSIAAFVLLAQEAWADLESPSAAKAYRAIEKLAAGGPELKAALEAKAARAEGRLKTHLQAALQGPVAPTRRVTLKGGPRGTLDALQDLARQSGLPLDGDSLLDEKLPEVTLDLEDVHPLEALAAVCRAAELAPSWEPDRIALYTGGFVDAPASPFGPFQLRISRLRQERVVEFVRAPRESLVLELALVFEHGLPLLGVPGIEVLEALDERGNDLRPPPAKPGAAEAPEAAPDLVARPELLQDLDLEVPLRAPPKGAKTLALLRGVLKVRLPRRLLGVDIAQPSPGSSASGPGFSLRVTHVLRDESRILCDLALDNRELAGRALIVGGLRPDGRRERTHATVLESPSGGLVHLAVEVQPRPAALRLDKEAPAALVDRLRLDLVEGVGERLIPFEFREIPLR